MRALGQVYDHAVGLFRSQAARHGAAFGEREAELRSAPYEAACEAKRQGGLQKRCKQMR